MALDLIDMSVLDLRKIPAPSDALSPSISHFSVVDDPTGSLPPEKMSSELVLVSSEGCEVLRKSSLAVDIIKRGGERQSERFMRKKLHASIVAACLSVRAPEGQAEPIAHAVCESVIAWLQQHPEVTSHDIRIIATKHLRIYHPEAAYLYEQHRITI